MLVLAEILRWGSAAALGIYAGAMLTEGGVLVPFWRSLAPAEFLRWYAANAERLVAYFGPVTIVSALLPLLAAATSSWEGHPGRWWAVGAAAIMVALVASYFVYFEQANERFAQGTVAVDAVPAELARWSAFHNARTALSVLAFVAALLAARQSP